MKNFPLILLITIVASTCCYEEGCFSFLFNKKLERKPNSAALDIDESAKKEKVDELAKREKLDEPLNLIMRDKEKWMYERNRQGEETKAIAMLIFHNSLAYGSLRAASILTVEGVATAGYIWSARTVAGAAAVLVPFDRFPKLMYEKWYASQLLGMTDDEKAESIRKHITDHYLGTFFTHLLPAEKREKYIRKWKDDKNLKEWIQKSLKKHRAYIIFKLAPIFIYTTNSYYEDVNKAIQDEKDKEGLYNIYQPYIKTIIETMFEMNYRGFSFSKGIVWRGMILEDTKIENMERLRRAVTKNPYWRADSFLWGGLISTSEDLYEALSFTHKKDKNKKRIKNASGKFQQHEQAVLFKIIVEPNYASTLTWMASVAIRISDASLWETEKEVLFAPFSRFWVTQVEEMEIPKRMNTDAKKIDLVTLKTIGRWVLPTVPNQTTNYEQEQPTINPADGGRANVPQIEDL